MVNVITISSAWRSYIRKYLWAVFGSWLSLHDFKLSHKMYSQKNSSLTFLKEVNRGKQFRNTLLETHNHDLWHAVSKRGLFIGNPSKTSRVTSVSHETMEAAVKSFTCQHHYILTLSCLSIYVFIHWMWENSPREIMSKPTPASFPWERRCGNHACFDGRISRI